MNDSHRGCETISACVLAPARNYLMVDPKARNARYCQRKPTPRNTTLARDLNHDAHHASGFIPEHIHVPQGQPVTLVFERDRQ